MHVPEIGCSIDDLDTPALCIDLDVMESNIKHMAALCRQHGVAWRPHSKAHKSPEIARWEIAEGAIGVTCAKLGEAEVMATGGVGDMLIANQLVGPHKMQRLAALRRRADPVVAVDDLIQAEAMSQVFAAAGLTLRVILEVDIGLNRAGVIPGQPTLRLAQRIDKLPGLKLAGIMGYEGHLLLLEDAAEKDRRIREAIAVLAETKDDFVKHGLCCDIVSAGGTGSFTTTITCPGLTELQAGGLIFMDAFYRHRCHVEDFDFALKLITTVVSRPAPDRAVIDAGRKSQYADAHPPLVVGRTGLSLARLSAEHGEFTLEPEAQHLQVGDRLELIPGYSDFTNVLHDEFYGIRGGKLEVIWPLAGRGKIR
ncbi:MAG: DSD1 family PLP-dependent enzyme [Pirellulales bacterium]